jgi:hypothetical protein
MTQIEGIRTASDTELAEIIARLRQECRDLPFNSPEYKLKAHWLTGARKVRQDRDVEEWSIAIGDPGDEIEN